MCTHENVENQYDGKLAGTAASELAFDLSNEFGHHATETWKKEKKKPKHFPDNRCNIWHTRIETVSQISCWPDNVGYIYSCY